MYLVMFRVWGESVYVVVGGFESAADAANHASKLSVSGETRVVRLECVP